MWGPGRLWDLRWKSFRAGGVLGPKGLRLGFGVMMGVEGVRVRRGRGRSMPSVWGSRRSDFASHACFSRKAKAEEHFCVSSRCTLLPKAAEFNLNQFRLGSEGVGFSPPLPTPAQDDDVSLLTHTAASWMKGSPWRRAIGVLDGIPSSVSPKPARDLTPQTPGSCLKVLRLEDFFRVHISGI